MELCSSSGHDGAESLNLAGKFVRMHALAAATLMCFWGRGPVTLMEREAQRTSVLHSKHALWILGRRESRTYVGKG